MKKIIELFNFLTIGAFLSTVILFIGDLFGFSLSLNFQLLWRILAGLLALTVLLNTGNIKKLLKTSTISKKFLLLSGLNLFLFALFLLFYPIFRFGSPFVWEDRIANFKAAQKIEITLNEPLNQSFQAKSNNLGTIGLRIISQEIVIEEEPEEATPSAELTENEETGAVQGINIEEGELDEELDGELFFGEPERIVFRIKEEEEKDYFYENTYELNQYWETNYFLFGFPVQKDSEGKNYIFEIEKVLQGTTGKTFIIEINSQGKFNFYPRYVYNLASLKTDWDPILLNISRKTTQFIEEQNNQTNLIFVFLLIELLIFVFLKKDDKKFITKLNSYLKYVFLISLFLVAFSFLKFEFIKNIDYLQNTIDNLSKYGFPLILSATTFGFLLFYFNKGKIEKDLQEEKGEEESIEKKRDEEFDKKFPFLAWFNLKYGIKEAREKRRYFLAMIFVIISPLIWLGRLPYILGRLAYKEGLFYTLILLLIIFNSYFIMVNNLDVLPLQNDEFLTWDAAKYISSGKFSLTDLKYGSDWSTAEHFYSRGLPYSLGVSLFTYIFGDYNSIFNLRIFSVILGIFSLIFFYLFCRLYLQKTISLIVLYFFSVFYLFVYHSRVSRFYSLLLLLFIIISYLFIKFYKNLVTYLENKEINLKRLFLSNKWIIFILIFLFFVGLKTHYNLFFIVFPILIFSFIYIKNKFIKWIAVLALSIIFIAMIINCYFYNFFPSWYFNSYGSTNIHFLNHIYNLFNFPMVLLIFFMSSLTYFKILPKNIQFSYITFVSIFSFFLFFVNGRAFHDPRYFIFLFPFLIIILIFTIYLIVKNYTNNKALLAVIMLIMSILLINKIQIAFVCKENLFFSCPISDETRIFKVDRWNYDYDKIYSIIKENMNEDTLLVGRSLYSYYREKYDISPDQEYIVSKVRERLRHTNYNLEDIKKKEVILLVYPQIVYTANNYLQEYEDIWNYLYNNEDKQLVYQSEEGKVLIFKIEKK
jgi:hypothetical protein